MKKRVLSLMMALVLCLSMLPMEALAEGTEVTAQISADSNEGQTGTNPGNVAEVTIGSNTTAYTDIDAAFSAAQEADSATVKLLSDVTINHADDTYGIRMTKGSITLDLNGMTLSQKDGIASDQFSPLSAVFYMDSCRLTIQDSTGGKAGRIVQPNGGPAIAVINGSTLIVKSGAIENTNTQDDFDMTAGKPNCAIYAGNGEVSITDGTLTGKCGIVLKESCKLTVTGDAQITGRESNALLVYGGTAQLSGGTYSSNDTHSIWVMDDGKAQNLLQTGYSYETTDGEKSSYSENGNGVVGKTLVKKIPENEIEYIDKNGKKEAQADCTEITSGTTSLTEGWYVAGSTAENRNVTIDGDVTVTGTVNLILCDGAALTTGSIKLQENANLTIYGQIKGTGTLKAVGANGNPAIGINAGEGKNAALSFVGGTLDLQGNTKLTGGLSLSGDATLKNKLKGGIFTNEDYTSHDGTIDTNDRIDVTYSGKYGSVSGLLAKGYAFAKYDKDTGNAGNIVRGDVKKLTEDVIVVEHPKHTMQEENGEAVCTECGFHCSHSFDADGICTDCGVQAAASVALTDENGNTDLKWFTVLNDAFAYTNDAHDIEGVKVKKAELTLLKDETVTSTCYFDYLYERTVDINLNGKTLTCTGRLLTIGDVKVSVHDGKINCTDADTTSVIYVQQVNSTVQDLTLKDVSIQTTPNEFHVSSAIHVMDGKLTIQGEGQYSVLEVNPSESAQVQLSGGSFAGIMFSSDTTREFTTLLAEGYIYEDENGNYLSNEALAAQAAANQSSKGQYYTDAVCVVKCTEHSFNEDLQCTKCGFLCTHKDGEKSTFNDSGVCTICGLVCKHPADKVSEVNGIYTCSDCGTQMTVKVSDKDAKTDTYYAKYYDETGGEVTLNVILEQAKDGDTVTLLMDDLIMWAFVREKTITLDMNGRTLMESLQGITVGDKDDSTESKLIVTGEGYSEGTDQKWLHYYAFRVSENGMLDLSGWNGMLAKIRVGDRSKLIDTNDNSEERTIGKLEIKSSTATISLRDGCFGEICYAGLSGTITLGSLLEKNGARAFMYADGDNDFVEYKKELSPENSSIKDVVLVRCWHDKLGDENTCEHCGMKYIAAIHYGAGGAKSAISAASFSREDLSEAALRTIGFLNDDGGTMQLLVDADLVTGELNRTDAVNIDLNGHKFTGDGTLTLSGGTNLTIRDDTTGKTGEFGNVKVNAGASLTVDGIPVGTLTASDSKAKLILKPGSSFEGYRLPAGMLLADWLEDGCCIYDTGADGTSRIPVELTTTGTGTAAGKYVVEKAAAKLTAGAKTGELAYESNVSGDFCPEVTLTDAAAYENFGSIRVDWYRRTDDGSKLMGSGSVANGTYVVNSITPDFNGVKSGDKLDIFCTITAVDNTPEANAFWQTVLTGYELTVVNGISFVLTQPAATADMVYKAAETDKKWSLVTAGTASGGTMVYSLSEDGVYTETIPTAENAGEYTVWYKVKGDENHNDTAPESVKMEIAKAEFAVDSFTLAAKVYDGTTDAVVTGVSFKSSDGTTIGGELVLGTDYTAAAVFKDANAGTGKEAEVTVTLLDTEKAGNYELTDNQAVSGFEIKKAQAPASATGTLYILNNRTDTYRYDLSRLLPELAEGCKLGTVTISIDSVTWIDVAYITVASSVENGNLLKFEVTSRGSVEGDAGKVECNVVTDNYEQFKLTLKVVSTNKKIVELKEGSTVAVSGSNQLTYGQKLSELTLGSAVFVEMGTDTEIKGTLKWSSPDAVPDAGTTQADWIFTPEDSDTYKEAAGQTFISVGKATPAVTELPTVAEREYDPGRTLTDSDLTGGVASVAGSWSWELAGAGSIPTVGNAGYAAVFTPADTTNYNTVTKTITVKVTKATPYIGEKPSAAAITYGATLAGSVLTGGKAYYKDASGSEIAGVFTWKQQNTKPSVSDSGTTEYEVTFIPADRVNYNTADMKITLTVNKAENAPRMPKPTMQAAYGTIKVGNVRLPNGWSWADADRDKKLTDDVPVIAEAVYTGADKGNYETEKVSITITRSECDHWNTVITNHANATCTAEGYTGDIYCADCDSLLTTGRKTAALGHDYTPVVTKEPTSTEEGVRTYTCSRCNDSYTESIVKLPEEQHTHSYKGSVNRKADCTHTGARTFTCSCGDSYTETIPALGHSYTSIVTRKATTTEEGIMTYVCVNCGYSYSQPIAKLPGGNAGEDSGKDGKTDDGVPDTGTETKPYIKDDSGKRGWDVIRLKLDDAKTGSNITVAMNGTTVVPKNIFDSITGEDITLVLDMGNGISWKINGKDIIAAHGDIDLGVTLGTKAGKAIPVDLINNITGERASINLTLAYDGEFGFTARLSVNLDVRNAGLYANLFYYNEQTTELEFVSAGQISGAGSAELAFTHASDYVIVVDAEVMKDGTKDSDNNPESTEAGDVISTEIDATDNQSALKLIILIIACICIILLVSGAVWYVRRKNGSEEE